MKSPFQIAEDIARTQERLEQLASEVGVIAREDAEAEAGFKIAFARARMTFRDEKAAAGEKFTTDTVEDYATIQTADLRRAHLLAAGRLLATREAIKSAQSQLDGSRTMSAAVRAAGG